MRRRPVDAVPRRVVLWTALGVTALSLFAAPPAQAARPTGQTALACLPVPHQIDNAGARTLQKLAESKLGAAATEPYSKYPFGALRAESTYTRMKGNKWASGFFTASLWRMYGRTHDEKWLTLARSFSEGLVPIARFRGSHDLGFMVGLPLGLGAELDPDAAHRERYHQAVITAARTLALRWNENVQALKSADYEGQWAVIVDSAMNAPLLIEVGQELGGGEGDALVAMGTGHMRTLARDFVRADGSTFHRMAFNPKTGAVVGPIPGQGLDPQTSTWARGQAWALNGFAQAYKLTKDPVIRQAALKTASYWTTNVRIGCVPAWDFDIANPRSPMDSSAASIAADGLLTLDAADPSTKTGDYARTLLGTLTAPWFLTTYSVNPGLLLQQSLNVNTDAREGTYVWGDYYLLAAVDQS